MKRAFGVVLVVAMLVSALIGTLLVGSVAANFFRDPPQTMNLTMQSPESKVYTQNSIPVEFIVSNFTVPTCSWLADPVWHLYLDSGFTFLLDAQAVKLPVAYSVSENNNQRTYRCRTLLPDLPEGTHVLTIVVTAESGARSSSYYATNFFRAVKQLVNFTVDASAPHVSILSLKPAETYNASMLPLDFTVSEPTASLSYSLDGGASVAIAGNTTLSGLSGGTHTLVVEAVDLAGSVGSSAPITFTVETAGSEQPGGSQPAPYSTTLVAVTLIVSAAAVSFGLVAYFLRRKSKRRNQT
jgi:hypothetical protein